MKHCIRPSFIQPRTYPIHLTVSLFLIALFTFLPTVALAQTVPVLGEWSNPRNAGNATDSRYLGDYERESISLVVSHLPAHAQVKLSVDLRIMGSWDGNAGEEVGPDTFKIAHSADQTLLNTSFSNDFSNPAATQAYPDAYPGGNHPPQTGAVITGTDSLYKLTFSFDHTASDLQISFGAGGLQGDGDETWGLDNIVIEIDGQRVYSYDAEFPSSEAAVEVALLLAEDRQADDTLGHAIALHEDLLAAGAPAWVADNLVDQNQRAGALYLFTRNPSVAYDWQSIQKLSPSDGKPNDRFGSTVALSADLLAVGAQYADGTGKVDQGAVYLFARHPITPTQWVEIQKLTAPDGVAEDLFGRSLTIDQSRLLVGSKEKAYLYVRGGNDQWTLQHTFTAKDSHPDQRFGDSLALDGNLVLIGASGAQIGDNYLQGAVYLFKQEAGNWTQIAKLTPADGEILTFFGYPIVTTGGQIIIGGSGQSRVYIFERSSPGNDSSWQEVQRLSSSDPANNYSFGSRLAQAGNRLLVGSNAQGELFERQLGSNQWTFLRKLQGSPGSSIDFGGSLAMQGDRVFVGVPSASTDPDYWHGAVAIFDLSRPAAPRFGFGQSEYSVSESVVTATIAITLDHPSPYPMTVEYAVTRMQHEATAPDDFTPISGLLHFATGASQAQINVAIANDTLLELNEQVRLSVFRSAGGLAGEITDATLTIVDDDTVSNCDFIASDEASLDRAIRCLYVAEPGEYTIQVTNNISLTRPLPVIKRQEAQPTNQLTIEGNGHTIDAQGHGRIFEIGQFRVDLRNLTVRGGRISTEYDPEFPNLGGGIYAWTENIGFGIEPSCAMTMTNVVLTDNQAYMGGGIYYGCEQPLIIRNSTFSNNRAIFGGAFSTSGGEEFFTEIFASGSTFSSNRATTNGGAFDLSSGDGGVILHLTNSTVSGNVAETGRGGGLWLDQAQHDGRSEAQVINSTIANNAASQGGGVQNSYGNLILHNSLVTGNHLVADTHIVTDTNRSDDCQLVVSLEEGTGRIVSEGNNLDSDGSCLPANVRKPSDIPAGDAKLGPLADNGGVNGGATQTHALLPGSVALDAADSAVCRAQPVNGVDQRGIKRPQGRGCDIGAFELESTGSAPSIFVSSTSSGKAGGVRFRDEDILRYDPTVGDWVLIFDGSDVEIHGDVDAFAFDDAGNLWLSLEAPAVLSGLGTVDDSDIVKFVPSKLGATTAGRFEWVLDGSDVGLSDNEEDIDAIDFAKDGRLLISTSNGFSVGTLGGGNLTGRDEDLFVLNKAVYGQASKGTWELYLDGSDVAISTGRDINGLWVDPANGDLYLSTNGEFAVSGLTGDQNDIFVCIPSSLGQETACTFHSYWQGDTVGFGGERIDGIDIGDTPPTFDPTAVNAADTEESDAVGELMEEPAEDDGVEEGQVYYLPMIVR